MKKMLFMLPMLAVLFIISSCSKDDELQKDEIENNDDLSSPSIIGTWEDGNYFVSFGEDGFYSAYIADEFIDSGDYDQTENEISCLNNYFNRETIYTIKNISDTEMNVEISYVDLHGERKHKTLNLTKSNDAIVSRSNTLSGKSITTYSAYFGNVTRTFNTFNSGIKSATKGSAKNYPLNFFYIYIGNRMYHQILNNSSMQVPTIGAWTTDYNEVICWELSFSPNGSINDFNYIEL